MDNGFLKLIIGPMFAGKTTELIQEAKKVSTEISLRISHSINFRDVDDEGKIVYHSHANEVLGNVFCFDKLSDIRKFKGYAKVEWIFIEELQFFEDCYEEVVKMVDLDGKKVVAAGLDGNFMREGFGRMLELVSMADEVVKKTAVCGVDGCDRAAPFTKKIGGDTGGDVVVDVGGEDKYLPVCRKHYSD